jgi:hypothetical protein
MAQALIYKYSSEYGLSCQKFDLVFEVLLLKIFSTLCELLGILKAFIFSESFKKLRTISGMEAVGIFGIF